MERFNVKRKGYAKDEVDAYISSMEKKYNDTLSEQMERIDSLKLECAIKTKELDKYRSRESDINEALLRAIEKAKEMDYTAKIRLTLEGERIKIFRSKWMNYCDRHKDNLRIIGERDNLADYLDAMDKEIAKLLEKDVNIKSECELSAAEEDFVSETRRSGGFNLDDINNPPDLKSICDDFLDDETDI